MLRQKKIQHLLMVYENTNIKGLQLNFSSFLQNKGNSFAETNKNRLTWISSNQIAHFSLVDGFYFASKATVTHLYFFFQIQKNGI